MSLARTNLRPKASINSKAGNQPPRGRPSGPRLSQLDAPSTNVCLRYLRGTCTDAQCKYHHPTPLELVASHEYYLAIIQSYWPVCNDYCYKGRCTKPGCTYCHPPTLDAVNALKTVVEGGPSGLPHYPAPYVPARHGSCNIMDPSSGCQQRQQVWRGPAQAQAPAEWEAPQEVVEVASSAALIAVGSSSLAVECLGTKQELEPQLSVSTGPLVVAQCQSLPMGSLPSN